MGAAPADRRPRRRLPRRAHPGAGARGRGRHRRGAGALGLPGRLSAPRGRPGAAGHQAVSQPSSSRSRSVSGASSSRIRSRTPAVARSGDRVPAGRRVWWANAPGVQGCSPRKSVHRRELLLRAGGEVLGAQHVHPLARDVLEPALAAARRSGCGPGRSAAGRRRGRPRRASRPPPPGPAAPARRRAPRPGRAARGRCAGCAGSARSPAPRGRAGSPRTARSGSVRATRSGTCGWNR